MDSFAMVVCPNDFSPFVSERSLLYPFPDWMKEVFIRNIKIKNLGEFAPCKQTELPGWIVYFPGNTKKLQKMHHKNFEKYMEQMIKWYNSKTIKKIYLGKNLRNILNETLSEKNKQVFQKGGMTLYASLVKDILREICRRNRWQLENLDICIINQKRSRMFFPLLKMVLADVRFISVVSDNEPSIGENIDRIYHETGEAIRVTSDIRSGTKECDIVISLDDLSLFKERDVFKENMYLVNLSDAGIKDNIYIRSNVINRIGINLPEEIAGIKYVREIKEDFESLEAAEFYIKNEYMIQEDDLEKYRTVFGASGMRIGSLIGRRGEV